MAKRVIDEPCDIPLYIRVSESMKKAVDSAADECQMSTSEWLRRAIEHELERESDDDGYYYPDGSRAITDEMLEEKLIKIAEKLKAQGKL